MRRALPRAGSNPIARFALAALALLVAGADAPPAPVPLAQFHRIDVRAPGESMAAGGLVVTNVSAPCDGDVADGADRCVAVRIAAPGDPAFTLAGTRGVNARVAIGRLARGAAPAVILETFTGGAHCCEQYAVAIQAQRGWRRVVLGGGDPAARPTEFDHGLEAFPTDRDGDGVADFVVGDDAFLYAFTDYADSWAPPVVLNLAEGRTVDVSRRPGFRPLFAADAAKARKDCVAAAGGRSPNGACAAYAADAARLGQFARAWPVIMAHYDRSLDKDGYPRCTVAYVAGRCPPGREQRYAGYPAALRAFLIRAGYLR